MSNKKRRVTFDPEPRPSSQATPPLLPLANWPPIISKEDIENIDQTETHKSILKNPPTDDKPYLSLCNFLIDLPPPPCQDLLSLDILQQETIFKPKNRFSNLIEDDRHSKITYDSSSSEEESDDNSLTESNIVNDITNITDIINEDDRLFEETLAETGQFESSLLLEHSSSDIIKDSRLIIEETIVKPKQFESSLLLEKKSQNIIEFSDIKIENNRIELEEPIDSSCWDKDIETDFKAVDVEFTDHIDNDIQILDNESSTDNISDTNYLLVSSNFEKSVETKIEEDIWPSNNQSEVDNIADIDISKNLDRRKSEVEELCFESYIPEITESPILLEQTFTNVRKLDEDHNELLEDFKIANKRNKVGNSPIRKDINFVESLISCETIEVVSNNLQYSKDRTALTYERSYSFPLVSDSVIDTRDITETLIDSSSTSQIYTKDTLTESQSCLSKSNDNLNDELYVKTTPTESVTKVPASNNNNTTEGVEASGRHRRKSGRKSHHRKHSHGHHRSASASQSTDHRAENTAIQESEQKALDAQARFKRYLGRMSAKAMNENQNLNCAGEEETLENHQRDSIKENQILIWIYNMIDEVARVDYEFFLKDGCILCKLMNRIVPESIPQSEITWEGARSKQKNIANFLREAEKYGVPKGKLFFSEDLLQLRHVPRVTRCIYALAKIAQSDTKLGNEIPQLGDEPSFLKDTAKPLVIPGHRDTKDVLAQLTASKEEDIKGKKTKHSLYQ